MNGVRACIGYLITAIATYYAVSLIQTIFHRWFGHTRRVERIFTTHVRGHHAQYSRELVSDRWIPTEQHITWYYAVPFVPMVLTAFWLLPVDIFIVHVVSLAMAIWWHVYLHRQYHLRQTWFSRFSWFRRKQQLHMIHHLRPHRNYAIIEYAWDRLFGTFDRETLPLDSLKARER